MKVEFEPPIQPNFIKVKNVGRIDIKDLEKEDLEELKIIVCNALEDNWRRRKFAKSGEVEVGTNGN